MKLLLTAVFIALCYDAILAQQAPASLLSTKVNTAYNSKCTTSSASTSLSSVPTTVTFSTNFPTRTVSSVNTFTPTKNVFVTSTPAIVSTVTIPTSTIFTQPVQRRELGFIQENHDRENNVRSLQDDDFIELEVRQGKNVDPKISQEQLDALMKEKLKYSTNAKGTKRNLRFERALYPANVQCAVTGIPGITSYLTSTGASRTVTRTASTITTALETVTVQAIQDPSFESYNNFWSEYQGGGVFVSGSYPHSGYRSFGFGTVGREGTLTSNPIPGNNGASYQLTFWLTETEPSPTAIFRVLWNGDEVFNSETAEPNSYWRTFANADQTTGQIPYKQYTVDLVGRETNILTFSARQDPAYWYLDDVRITSV